MNPDLSVSTSVSGWNHTPSPRTPLARYRRKPNKHLSLSSAVDPKISVPFRWFPSLSGQGSQAGKAPTQGGTLGAWCLKELKSQAL